MNNLVFNFIEINLIILVLYLAFLLLKKSINYTIQRAIVLAIPIVSIIVVVFKNTILHESAIFNSIPIFNLNVIEVGDVTTSNTSTFWSIEMIYLSVVALLFFWLVLKVSKVLIFFRKAERQKNSSINILSPSLSDNFSFFNFIHISADLNETEKQVVLEHELSHTHKLHAFDLMVMAIYHVVFWINPIFFLMKKKLIEIHEYEVDAGMFKRYNNQYVQYLLANTLKGNSSHYLLTSQFYNGLSLTKRTKQMKTTIKNKWALLLVFPVLAVGFTLLSLKSNSPEIITNQILGEEQDTIKKVVKVYDVVDKQPEYVGGDKAMIQFIIDNIVYPKADKEAGIEGTVFCEFVIQADGNIGKIKIVKGKTATMDAEVVRVISLMPKWTPGELEGKKVAVKYTMPVKFVLPKKLND